MKNNLTILLIIFLQACTTVSKQTSIIFNPEKLATDYKFTLPDNTKEINIKVDNRAFLNGLLFEKIENKILLIYFQGNSKNLQNFLDNHRMVLDWGYNVLVTDYRGFGKSNGILKNQSKMYSDAEKVYEHAISLGYKPENIVLYGYSMGTSMAAYLASTRTAKALILESAFSSIPEISWVNNQAPNFELNTKDRAKNITIPTLLIHGDQDEVISPDHSLRIYNNLKTTSKQRIVLENGGHGNLRNRPEYQKLINTFINQL
jgi:pimeloyl-ACP methyl ester carboxylesterase